MQELEKINKWSLFLIAFHERTRGVFLYSILFGFILIGCSKQKDAPRKDTTAIIDTLKPDEKEAILKVEKDNEEDNELSSLCYSAQTGKSEKGYLGIVDGKTELYYEIWALPSSMGSSTHSIILRSDTIDRRDSIEFCIENDQDYDSLYVTLYQKDSTINFTTVEGNKIPSVFQVLIPKILGYEQFYNFNKPNSRNRIYLKQGKLYLTYINSLPYDQAPLATELYEMVNGRFVKTRSVSKPLKE